MVAIDTRVGYAVHDDQCSAETVTGQTFEIIVADDLAFVDDSDSTGVIDTIAQENVAFHNVFVAVAQYHSALDSKIRLLRIMFAPDLIEMISTSPSHRSKTLFSIMVLELLRERGLVRTRRAAPPVAAA